jgi:hypothetical protein
MDVHLLWNQRPGPSVTKVLNILGVEGNSLSLIRVSARPHS